MSEEDRLYEESVRRIQSAVKTMPFDKAAEIIEVKDEATRRAILDDALKVLLAEMHFAGGESLEDIARKLRLPVKRLSEAKAEMLKDVEAAAIEAYKASMKGKGTSGTA